MQKEIKYRIKESPHDSKHIFIFKRYRFFGYNFWRYLDYHYKSCEKDLIEENIRFNPIHVVLFPWALFESFFGKGGKVLKYLDKNGREVYLEES